MTYGDKMVMVGIDWASAYGPIGIRFGGSMQIGARRPIFKEIYTDGCAKSTFDIEYLNDLLICAFF